MKTSHQIIISKATNEKTETRKTLPVYTQEIDPNINTQRTKSKLLKFHINSSRQHRHNTSEAALQQKILNGQQNFRTLNHHYRMKIALIKRKLKTKPSHQVINNS